MMDFYYSEKMRRMCDSLDSAEKGEMSRHVVMIDGELKPFTMQTKHGKGHGSGWDDIVFIGTSEEGNVKYNFVKENFTHVW